MISPGSFDGDCHKFNDMMLRCQWIFVRGHYVLPFLMAHSQSPSNSMDPRWPAVDNHRTSQVPSIFTTYFTCHLSGHRVVTYILLYIRQQVLSLGRHLDINLFFLSLILSCPLTIFGTVMEWIFQ